MRRGRRGHGGGSHGGNWKVAYADFVTSMMALFLVLWLVGSDQETRLAVQRYFAASSPSRDKIAHKISPRHCRSPRTKKTAPAAIWFSNRK